MYMADEVVTDGQQLTVDLIERSASDPTLLIAETEVGTLYLHADDKNNIVSQADDAAPSG